MNKQQQTDTPVHQAVVKPVRKAKIQTGAKAGSLAGSKARRKPTGNQLPLQLAMILVAVVIGIALFAEQNFSPIVAIGISALAYGAFRALHNLLDTAHKVGRLGTGLELDQSGQAGSQTPAIPEIVPDFARKSEKSDTNNSDQAPVSKRTTSAPFDPASLEQLKPSGQMTSDLIAQALRKELPPVEEKPPVEQKPSPKDKAAPTGMGNETPLPSDQLAPEPLAEDTLAADPLTEAPLTEAPLAADPLTEAPLTEAPLSADPLTEAPLAEDTKQSDEMVKQIAHELNTMRPEFDTKSVDSLARDLEAATMALEAELNGVPLDIQHEGIGTAAEQAADKSAIDAKQDEPEIAAEIDPEPLPETELEDKPETELEDKEEKNSNSEIRNRDELDLKDLVSKAVISSRAKIYLQPILGLAARKADSFEVLTHLENDQGKMLPPSEFLDEAERAGQMPTIDNAMLERTLRILRKLQATGAPGNMFCNLSIFSLSDDKVVNALLETLSKDPATANRLIIELSEQAYLACTPSDRQKLDDLRELGVRLSMDHLTDAGIFMDALKSRIFSFIKVDAAFFLNRLGSGPDALMPAEILSEARLADVDLIIEKIETEEELERAIEFGAKFGQGHIFSEPRPVRSELLEDVA